MQDYSTARPATLKRVNMRRFLDELRRSGPSSRADLSRSTGVAAPTSSGIIADLLELGLLESADAPEGLSRSGAKGRPGKLFRLASDTAYVLGVTIGVEECVAVPAGLDGAPRPAMQVNFETPKTYEDLLLAIEAAIRAVEAPGRCLGVGLSVPGLVEERSGRVAFSPNLQILNGRSIGPDLEARLDTKVVCTQEEHALCLAEWISGAGREFSDFIALDLSSGMGMGVVSGGRYVSGRDGFAGEIGHTTVEPDGPFCGCGNRGCLETLATDTAFLHAVRDRLGYLVTMDEAANLDVSSELDRVLSYLAIGLASLVNVFNPEAIILNGRLLDLRPGLLEDLQARVSARALAPSAADVRLFRAKGDKSFGALAGLLDRLFAEVGPRLM